MIVPDQLPVVLRALESVGLPYLMTGSLASVAWGEPRATYDLDIVIELSPGDVDHLLKPFAQPEWYVDQASVLHAIRIGGEFNLIHSTTGTKVDFWIKSSGGFDDSRFERRRREEIAGVTCWIQSPEDAILSKLLWIKISPSDRQERDVSGIIKVQGDLLDRRYLFTWAKRLAVEGLLNEILEEGSP